MGLRPTLRFASVLPHSDNKRVFGSGFQPSPKSPSATSDTRQTLGDMANIKHNREVIKWD